jgi:glycosyltransferase involved in cell wall biosynthesis
MIKEDLVSIIMPSYNTGGFIAQSIQSVQNQTYQNWEMIIVDDCSTDNTDAVVEGYLCDKRIKYIKNDKNSGAAVSRNRALREAKGRWIAFLDSDDIWEPTKIEEQLAFMKKHGYAFTFTDYRIQLNGEWLPYIYIGPNKVNKRRMYNYCYFSTITVMYDQSKVGLIQIADLKKNNDYAMWLKAVEKVDCYRYPKCLSYYIKHEGSISSGNKIKLIKWHYLLFRKGQGFNPFISGILTVNNLAHGVSKKMIFKYETKEIPNINC